MKQLKKLNEKGKKNHFVPLNMCLEGVCQWHWISL